MGRGGGWQDGNTTHAIWGEERMDGSHERLCWWKTFPKLPKLLKFLKLPTHAIWGEAVGGRTETLLTLYGAGWWVWAQKLYSRYMRGCDVGSEVQNSTHAIWEDAMWVARCKTYSRYMGGGVRMDGSHERLCRWKTFPKFPKFIKFIKFPTKKENLESLRSLERTYPP